MAKKANPPTEESGVVVAKGTAGGTGLSSQDVQQAMSDAAAKAQEEGITDPDEVRQRMLDARAALKAQARAAASQAAE